MSGKLSVTDLGLTSGQSPPMLNPREMGGNNDLNPIFEKLVTKRQLSESLEISTSFISKLMSEEGLPYLKIGRAVRFRVSEVVDWLQRRTRP